MSKTEDWTPSRAADPFATNNPQIHALILEEHLSQLENGISTLFELASDGQHVDASPYAVNFVAHAIERISGDIRDRLKDLKHSLGMGDDQQVAS
jgi:hypothetical protein